jgi:hypothetical protein
VKASRPPAYVNTPVPIAYAQVDDALIVTMTRILGLCWTHDYERTPALTPEQLAELTGRPRSTLYRHLKQLCDLHWLRVDQAGRRIILRPIVGRQRPPGDQTPARGEEPADEPLPNPALLQALAEIGVENPRRTQLACGDIDPLWVRAWHLWARHPHRKSLTNPIGNIILKLESGQQPPAEFLRAAEEQLRLRERMWEQEGHDGQDPEEDDASEPAPDSVLAEARRIWAESLTELQLQMTRATFEAWLRGSRVVDAGEDSLTIAVRQPCAVDWLQHRLLPVIGRTVARHAGRELRITFVTGT